LKEVTEVLNGEPDVAKEMIPGLGGPTPADEAARRESFSIVVQEIDDSVCEFWRESFGHGGEITTSIFGIDKVTLQIGETRLYGRTLSI
jgi:hypothetical protein